MIQIEEEVFVKLQTALAALDKGWQGLATSTRRDVNESMPGVIQDLVDLRSKLRSVSQAERESEPSPLPRRPDPANTPRNEDVFDPDLIKQEKLYKITPLPPDISRQWPCCPQCGGPVESVISQLDGQPKTRCKDPHCRWIE